MDICFYLKPSDSCLNLIFVLSLSYLYLTKPKPLILVFILFCLYLSFRLGKHYGFKWNALAKRPLQFMLGVTALLILFCKAMQASMLSSYMVGTWSRCKSCQPVRFGEFGYAGLFSKLLAAHCTLVFIAKPAGVVLESPAGLWHHLRSSSGSLFYQSYTSLRHLLFDELGAEAFTMPAEQLRAPIEARIDPKRLKQISASNTGIFSDANNVYVASGVNLKDFAYCDGTNERLKGLPSTPIGFFTRMKKAPICGDRCR